MYKIIKIAIETKIEKFDAFLIDPEKVLKTSWGHKNFLRGSWGPILFGVKRSDILKH